MVNVLAERYGALLLSQQEIHELNASLERRVADRTHQLDMANTELQAFSYSVSHDLRAPLRGLDGWSQALQEVCGDQQIGRASCRERVCQYVLISVVHDSLKKEERLMTYSILTYNYIC